MSKIKFFKTVKVQVELKLEVDEHFSKEEIVKEISTYTNLQKLNPKDKTQVWDEMEVQIKVIE